MCTCLCLIAISSQLLSQDSSEALLHVQMVINWSDLRYRGRNKMYHSDVLACYERCPALRHGINVSPGFLVYVDLKEN